MKTTLRDRGDRAYLALSTSAVGRLAGKTPQYAIDGDGQTRFSLIRQDDEVRLVRRRDDGTSDHLSLKNAAMIHSGLDGAAVRGTSLEGFETLVCVVRQTGAESLGKLLANPKVAAVLRDDFGITSQVAHGSN